MLISSMAKFHQGQFVIEWSFGGSFDINNIGHLRGTFEQKAKELSGVIPFFLSVLQGLIINVFLIV